MGYQYPEHEKLAAVAELSQEIGQFLDWYGTHYPDGHTDIPMVLAQYFKIDLNILESEKRRMLARFRAEVAP